MTTRIDLDAIEHDLKFSGHLAHAVLATDVLALVRAVRAFGRFREWVDMLRLTHDAVCNGVHSDGGLCEGEVWRSQAEDEADDALAPFRKKENADG